MTDNEKAATFIGWKPNTLCYLSDNDGFCVIHNTMLQFGVGHILAAPNITDPRNYMKALENIAQTHPHFDDFEAAFVRTIINRDGSEMVTALAALYDAEHKSPTMTDPDDANG